MKRHSVGRRTSARRLLAVASAGVGLVAAIRANGATLAWDADANAATGVNDGSGTWDLLGTNWYNGSANIAWPNSGADIAVFGNGGNAGTVTLGANSDVTVNAIQFNGANGLYNLAGGSLTLTGTSATVTANVDALISAPLAGSVGLIKNGAGNLTLTGAETFTGTLAVNGGTLTFGGASTVSNTVATGNVLTVGAGTAATLNLDSTGTLFFNGSSSLSPILVGSSGGVGTVNQTGAGTVILSVNASASLSYAILGYLGSGSYQLANGTLTTGNGSNGTTITGMRVGDGANGNGSLYQTGGTLLVNKYFAIGSDATSTSNTIGVVTLAGGTANLAYGSKRVLIGDANYATATMSIGTLAGGNASVSATTDSASAGAISVGNSTNQTATLNLNAGTLTLNKGGLHNNASGTTTVSTVNLNGATLRPGTEGLTLIDTSMSRVSVYNGGGVVDTNGFNASISAPLVAATGGGLYPAGGTVSFTVPDGIGALFPGLTGTPVVTLTDTSRATANGASAIPIVTGGALAGLIITNPGQGYVDGDNIKITLTGGGVAAAANSVTLEFDAGTLGSNQTVVQANANGGFTKNGVGTLTLTGSNTYTGATTVNGGTLRANSARVLSGSALVASATGTGAVTVNVGGTLGGSGGTGDLVVNGTITAGADAATPGTLTTGAQRWNAGGAFLVKFNTSGGTTVAVNDKLVMSGLTIGATAAQTFTVNLSNLSAGTITYASPIQVAYNSDAANNPFSPANTAATLAALKLVYSGIAAPAGYTLQLDTRADASGTGFDLIVDSVTATPEPASMLLGAAAVAPVMLGRRRRRQRVAG